MRSKALALIIALVAMFGLTSTTAGAASAAADITKGNVCSLSASWDVNVSVNFNNTSGSPSTGTIDYLVLSSPGPLTTRTLVQWYNANGATLGYTGIQGFTRDTSKPGYVYRADPAPGDFGTVDHVTGVRRIIFNPAGGPNQTECSEYGGAAVIYSSN